MSALGSLIKGAFDIGNNALSNVYARKAAKTEYDRNIALWNMENEYNTPVNQMARLREAGLNPNLVAGSLSSSAAGSVGRAPQVHLRSPLEGLDLVGSYQDIRQRDASIEQLKLQNKISRHMWPLDEDLKNAQFNNAKEQNDILKETLKQEKLRTSGMAYDLELMKENSSHKTGFSYRWARNIGEWMNALSPFVQSGADVGSSYLRWHK